MLRTVIDSFVNKFLTFLVTSSQQRIYRTSKFNEMLEWYLQFTISCTAIFKIIFQFYIPKLSVPSFSSVIFISAPRLAVVSVSSFEREISSYILMTDFSVESETSNIISYWGRVYLLEKNALALIIRIQRL